MTRSNRRARRSCFVCSATLFGALLWTPGNCFGVAFNATLQVVALTNTLAPAGGNFIRLDRPMVNEMGQVAFTAMVFDGVHQQQQGLFTGTPGAINNIELQYTPAPTGGNYDFIQQAVLNNAGQVAFRTALIGGSSSEGIFVGTPASVESVAIDGTPAPGGGSYTDFRDDLAFNDSSQVVFGAELRDGTASAGLFLGPPGAIQPIALQGQAAPDGGDYVGFIRPALNRFGQVAFHAFLTGGSASEGLFVGAPGSFQTAALVGAPAPTGGTISALTDVRGLNGAGEVAFFASLTGGSSPGGYFVGKPGALQGVGLIGTPAPGGGNYNGIGGGARISLNEDGQVGFQAILSGGMFNQGSFFGQPDSLQPVAFSGTASPDGPNFGFVADPTTNSSGQLLVYAILNGPGITAANNDGLCARVADSLFKVVREGDKIDVDSGLGIDLRTIADSGIEYFSASGGDDGHSSSFSDSGYFALKLSFTDRSSGIFLVKLPSVPEPSSAALAAIGIAVCVSAIARRIRSA